MLVLLHANLLATRQQRSIACTTLLRESFGAAMSPQCLEETDILEPVESTARCQHSRNQVGLRAEDSSEMVRSLSTKHGWCAKGLGKRKV